MLLLVLGTSHTRFQTGGRTVQVGRPEEGTGRAKPSHTARPLRAAMVQTKKNRHRWRIVRLLVGLPNPSRRCAATFLVDHGGRVAVKRICLPSAKPANSHATSTPTQSPTLNPSCQPRPVNSPAAPAAGRDSPAAPGAAGPTDQVSATLAGAASGAAGRCSAAACALACQPAGISTAASMQK